MKERSKKVSEQLLLGGGSFKRKASCASRVRVFVELFCCSISSHKYSGAVRGVYVCKVEEVVCVTKGNSGHGCEVASTLCKYGFIRVGQVCHE